MAGGKTIIHCIAGVSRSVSLCAAYLMTELKSEQGLLLKSKMGANEAVQYIWKRRNCANPNPSFRSQLKTFEGQLKKSSNLTNSSNCLTELETKTIESMKTIIQELKLKTT